MDCLAWALLGEEEQRDGITTQRRGEERGESTAAALPRGESRRKETKLQLYEAWVDEQKRWLRTELERLSKMSPTQTVTYTVADLIARLSDLQSLIRDHADALELKTVGEESAVDNPAHYTAGKVETIDKIEAVVEGLPAPQAVLLANVIKYVDRAGLKGDAGEDLAKANNYAHRLVFGDWRSA